MVYFRGSEIAEYILDNTEYKTPIPTCPIREVGMGLFYTPYGGASIFTTSLSLHRQLYICIQDSVKRKKKGKSPS